MATRKISLICYHTDCVNDPPLEVIIDVSATESMAGGMQQREVYCARDHLNFITVPAAWGGREPVLSDEGVVDLGGGTPLVRGQEA